MIFFAIVCISDGVFLKEYQRCCCTRNIYSLKTDSAIIFPRGTKPLLMTWTLTSFIYFVLYGDIYGFLSSQPDSSTLAGFRMTEPKQWWLATWPSHDFATCSLRHFWLGLRGSDIQSNAVIHTHPRQVRAHSDLACFRFLGSPPTRGWRKHFREALWTSKSSAQAQQSWKYIQYLTAFVWILFSMHP